MSEGGEPVVALRPATAEDRDFLARVYAAAREQELSTTPFTPEQRAAFLEQQFEAQSLHYERHYADASFDVVLVDGEPAGRLIVGRWPRETRVVDIALLPEHRGRGIGGGLLRGVLAESGERGVKTTIHVGRSSPALDLYRRLGFLPVAEDGVDLLMERPPGPATEPTPVRRISPRSGPRPGRRRSGR